MTRWDWVDAEDWRLLESRPWWQTVLLFLTVPLAFLALTAVLGLVAALVF